MTIFINGLLFYIMGVFFFPLLEEVAVIWKIYFNSYIK